MRKIILLALAGLLALGLPARMGFGPAQDADDEDFDQARLAWDIGDFPAALKAFRDLLNGPAGDRYFERIALITGELFQVREIVKDGRMLRFSPDGRWAACETGPRTDPTTRVFPSATPEKTGLEIRGSGLVFSPSGGQAAFLRLPDTPEISKLRGEIEGLSSAASPDRQALAAKQREWARREAAEAAIVRVDLVSRKEKTFRPAGLLKSGLQFAVDGGTIYFAGAPAGDESANQIYALAATGEVRPVTAGPGFKANPVAVPGGSFLIYTIPPTTPFPRPAPPAKPAAGNPAPENRPAAARSFALFDLASQKTWAFAGTGVLLSTDGSALVFLSQEGAETVLDYLKLGGDLKPVVLKKTPERIGSAAPAADGSRVVFDITYARNQEVFVIGADGRNETRVTREVEHDRAARFLADGRILAIKGEPRHSRAFLYDLKSGGVLRVFHNNTLRTISPEYEWAVDPSGTKVLIGAERDGDTIAAKRGVYLVDLDRKIGRSDLLARIAGQLQAENSLRARARTMFEPIRAEARSAADRVSITKIYDHETALFDFDSKYITQPGNRKAAEYISAQLKSFGYAPEYQEFDARGTRTANVLARLPGTENPEILYVLSGHFDSNVRSPGADDNTSVTAINLEAARLLAGRPLPYTVVFAFFTGEEAGLLGSREFVRAAREKGWTIAADINNDMIGWTDDHRLDDTLRYANPGLRDLQHAAAILFSRMITYDVRYVKSTDAVSFYDAYGDVVSGLGSYPVLGNPYYHQPTDLLETVNHQLLVEAAKANVASIMLLASSPRPVKGLRIKSTDKDSVTLAWESNAEKDVTAYLLEIALEGAPGPIALSVQVPEVTVPTVTMKKGQKLRAVLRAVTSRGIQSWDAARAPEFIK
jgi:hypothetical protein